MAVGLEALGQRRDVGRARRRRGRRSRPGSRACRSAASRSRRDRRCAATAPGNATAPWMWPPRGSPLSRQPLYAADRAKVHDRQARVAQVVRARSAVEMVVVDDIGCGPFRIMDAFTDRAGGVRGRHAAVPDNKRPQSRDVTAAPRPGIRGVRRRCARSAQRSRTSDPGRHMAGPPAHTHVAGDSMTDHDDSLPE